MPVELVLLSRTAPTEHDLLAAALSVVPDASYLDWADGTVRQVVDPRGQSLLQVYSSRPVADPHEAATMIAVPAGGPAGHPTDGYRYWTDITVARHGDPATGQAIATAVAQSTGGMVARRR